MRFSDLLEALSQPSAYPFPVDAVEVIHTHISAVFLAGSFVYKVKKPVNLGFLDFSTLAKRQHFCAEEVRLNRRLASSVYLGVVPVTSAGTGVSVEGSGEVIEWAVKMVRLPADATLSARLDRGEVSIVLLESLAKRLSEFHAHAESGPAIAAYGRFDVVARNARENFEQAQPCVGKTISQAVFERLRRLTEEHLERLRLMIESRADRGMPRDTHGDLHLDHVYTFPDAAPPADLVIVDCIEFNERFRYADPAADMAFLTMDLKFHGRRDLASAFANAYFRAAGDAEGSELLRFYSAYRAAVRGKVEGFELAEPEIPEVERHHALVRARAHWLLALGELEEPRRRPCLLLVAGLPGSGKSSLSRDLAAAAGFTVIRSDVVRKNLAGVPETQRLEAGFYSDKWNERTYAECQRQAEALLFEGRRVIVDASFSEEVRRLSFLELAKRWSVPSLMLHCQASADVVKARLQRRTHDASDADWRVHQLAAERWQPADAATLPFVRIVSTEGSQQEVLQRALGILNELDV